MVGGKKYEGQVNGGCADLHSDSIREFVGSRFRIGLARKRRCELKRGWSGHAAGMRSHGMSPIADGLDPWIHPFRTVLSQLLIIPPQVGMVVVELGQEIVQFRGIFCLHGMSHASS